MGLTDHEIFPKELADLFVQEDRNLLESDDKIETVQHITVDGVDRVFLTRKTLLRDEQGNPSGVCGVSADITAQLPGDSADEPA